MNEANNLANRFFTATRDVTDAWQHSRSATDWSHLFEQLTPGPFAGHTREAWLGPLQVIHERVDQAFAYQGRPWKGSRVFLVSLPARGNLYYDGRPMPDNVLVTHRWDSVGRAAGSGSVESVLIAVDEDFLAQYTQRVLGRHLFTDRRHALVSSSDPAIVARFRDTVLDLLDAVDQEPALLLEEHSRLPLQDRILTMLLEVLEPGGHSGEPLPRPSTRAYVVDKAVEFMNAHLAQPIVLADVCEALRVSPRTLRYSFAEIVGVSPTRYLLAHRLNGARRDLARAGRKGTVEEVALRWGFWHMSRFAHFYRLTFGQRPSETWHQAYDSSAGRSAMRKETLSQLSEPAFA
jgi:AraC family transcriptional regulator, ethanolamine operon transcriptional activator